MKRPSDQAKLLLFALLRSTATTALAITGEKAGMVAASMKAAASPHLSASTMLRMSSSASVSSSSAASSANTVALPNIQLRLARRTDVPSIQRCNLACLPENYNAQFYCSHLRQWPDLALVAEHLDENPQQQSSRPFGGFLGRQQQPEPKIVAYVLGKVDARPSFNLDELASKGPIECPVWEDQLAGHVTSLAVSQDYRRQGLAQALMKQLHFHLEHGGASSCGLHVRTSNKAACKLYEHDGYEIARVIPAYYQDGEDAYFMKRQLEPIINQQQQQYRNSNNGAVVQYDDDIEELLSEECWKAAPTELKLPRRHVFPARFVQSFEDDENDINSNNSSNNNGEPELLTGTM